MEFRVHHSLSELARPAWDALLDPEASPFLRWDWLEPLERTGCVGGTSGWLPCHFTLQRGGELVAAAPAYIKHDSDGDFSRDWGWADAAERARLPYYPKLTLGIPFTPCTGRRILVAPGHDRAVCTAALVAGARDFAARIGAHSLHVLFPLPDEATLLAELGLARRSAYQYHWHNAGYASFEEFLARFDSKRRNQIRRERAAPDEAGLTLRTVRGEALRAEPRRWAELADRAHQSTIEKLAWGRRWIGRAFYQRVMETMADAVELVVAETRDGRAVAMAFNVTSPTHLYGRYWGCLEEHRFLHFNVCMYHSIDECIRRGAQVFEGGAGGEHKIPRGFLPTETFSAHQFFDERLDRPIRRYIAVEAEERQRALAEWHRQAPVLKARAAS